MSFHFKAQRLKHNLGHDVIFGLTYRVIISQGLAIVSCCLAGLINVRERAKAYGAWCKEMESSAGATCQIKIIH